MTRIKIPLIIFGLMITLAAIISSIFFYNQYRQVLKSRQALTEIEEVVRKVSALMELPQEETPTLATVSDKTQLQNQSFFQNAENGDRILVYSQAKRAILYRPSTNKIVDVAPVMPLEGTTAKEATAAAEITAVTVSLYNGTKVAGLARLAGEKLEGSAEIGPKIKIVKQENANSDYSTSLIVDLSGNQADLAEKIAVFLKGTVGLLPDGEETPEAQIAVFLGTQ